ncbi:hypothetical protein KEF85_05430 [Methylomonas paludis]|uniref:Nucleotidyltransferase n=1 Tax=Methylomonas paludis TaxID=1173101 RepID=A0A975R9Y2_9GAMM|nr:hypothetical protein [Methylomonas paludis]QWF71900.1 hypothetical protein KEF85_05430 [Methylomonas paludis]
MLDKFGTTQQCIDCFVVYLAGHNRPIHEVLFPHTQSLKVAYDNEFSGMARDEVSLVALIETQQKIIADLPSLLSDKHKQFLFSLGKSEPDWSLMPFDHLYELPAIRWKLLNLQKLKQRNPKKIALQCEKLEMLLSRG